MKTSENQTKEAKGGSPRETARKQKERTEGTVFKKYEPFLYGLNGICELFHISKPLAFKYSHGLLKDACTKQGKKIIVDTEKAMRLFGIENPERFIKRIQTVKTK